MTDNAAQAGCATQVDGFSLQDVSPLQDDEDDLRDSLSALSQLVMTTQSLPQTLTHIAEFAVGAIPGADGAGLTLLQCDLRDAVVASADFVVAADTIQYSLGEGPCITAAENGRSVRSGSLGGDARWPRFGPRVGRLGVHSVLSLPLKTGEGVIGALNVYAHDKDAFDDRAVSLGELFAVPAAVSVQNAQTLANALLLTQQLQKALVNRKVIDHAIGILVSRTGCSSNDAFAKLRDMSQKNHTKLTDVAQSIFDDAKRRARVRR